MRSWRRLKPSSDLADSGVTVVVKVDQKSYALIEQCAHALAEANLPWLIDEMCEAGSFNETIQTKQLFDNSIVVSLGPMTELVLRECVDVASRKEWSTEKKSKWLRLMMTVAGLRQPLEADESLS